MLFTKTTIGSEQNIELIEAELRLDPVSCMMKAQVINSGATDDNSRLAACMPVLWDDSAEIDPNILEKH
tara:strand:- start:74 stop:280 length:207 start_codon:yes stop_codon:yes gene_type:complete